MKNKRQKSRRFGSKRNQNRKSRCAARLLVADGPHVINDFSRRIGFSCGRVASILAGIQSKRVGGDCSMSFLPELNGFCGLPGVATFQPWLRPSQNHAKTPGPKRLRAAQNCMAETRAASVLTKAPWQASEPRFSPACSRELLKVSTVSQAL